MRVFYSTGQRYATAVIGALVGGYLTLLTVLPDAQAMITYRIFMGVLAASWLVFAWRVVRTEVRVEDNTIIVRNPIRTHNLTMSEVARFEIRPCGLSLLGEVVRRDGFRIPTWGLQSGNRFMGIGRKALLKKVEDINALLLGH
jgi:hypothetical protein